MVVPSARSSAHGHPHIVIRVVVAHRHPRIVIPSAARDLARDGSGSASESAPRSE
jgi:hypothetical protein